MTVVEVALVPESTMPETHQTFTGIVHRHGFVFQLEYQGYKASNAAAELNTGTISGETSQV